jgi:lipopolysaccharide export system protein LptC
MAKKNSLKKAQMAIALLLILASAYFLLMKKRQQSQPAPAQTENVEHTYQTDGSDFDNVQSTGDD